MTLADFTKNFNFHDSSIVDLVFNEDLHTAVLTIELSWWQQNAYKDGDPEIVEKTFHFDGVTDFDCPEDIPFDQVGVFSVNTDNHCINIYVVNDFTDEEYSIKFKADHVFEIG